LKPLTTAVTSEIVLDAPSHPTGDATFLQGHQQALQWAKERRGAWWAEDGKLSGKLPTLFSALTTADRRAKFVGWQGGWTDAPILADLSEGLVERATGLGSPAGRQRSRKTSQHSPASLAIVGESAMGARHYEPCRRLSFPAWVFEGFARADKFDGGSGGGFSLSGCCSARGAHFGARGLRCRRDFRHCPFSRHPR